MTSAMHGRIPDAVAAPLGAQPANTAFVAVLLGALSLASPPLVLLGLAVLSAKALHAASFNVASAAGPVLAAMIVGAFAGPAGAIGVTFVWRLFADARWSIREAARLAHASGRPYETSRRALAHAWATPIHGLAMVAFTAPHMVAGLPLDLPHVPLWLPLLTGALAVAALFDWALKCATDWRLGELSPVPSAHLLAHHALFLVAFGVGLDVSAGFVAMAAWRLAHAARGLPQASFTAVP